MINLFLCIFATLRDIFMRHFNSFEMVFHSLAIRAPIPCTIATKWAKECVGGKETQYCSTTTIKVSPDRNRLTEIKSLKKFHRQCVESKKKYFVDLVTIDDGKRTSWNCQTIEIVLGTSDFCCFLLFCRSNFVRSSGMRLTLELSRFSSLRVCFLFFYSLPSDNSIRLCEITADTLWTITRKIMITTTMASTKSKQTSSAKASEKV